MDHNFIQQGLRGWKTTTSERVGKSLLKIAGELITNSVDSYYRLNKSKNIKKFNVFINYMPIHKNYHFYVTDNAEGMSSKNIEDIIYKYGDMRSGSAARGLFGFGLKDVCIAVLFQSPLKESHKIISIKNNKINIISLYADYKEDKIRIKWYKKDEKVSKKERKEYNIPDNGTRVEVILPSSSFNVMDPDKFYIQLCNYIQLRKINQLDKINMIFFKGITTGSKKSLIQYKEPKGKVILQPEPITINYTLYTCENCDKFFNKINVPDKCPLCKDKTKVIEHKLIIKTVIKEAEEDLSQHGYTRTGGILSYFDEYATIGCDLFYFNNNIYAKKLFGECEIKGFKKLVKKDQNILSTSRTVKGFNIEHEFYDIFSNLINEHIETVINKIQEKTSGSDFDIKNKRQLLKKLNSIIRAIDKDEVKKYGPPAELPVENISFYYRGFDTIEIKHLDEKGMYLVVNTQNVPHGSKIYLSSTNRDIKISPSAIIVGSKKDTDRINYPIKILGTKANVQGRIVANLRDIECDKNIFVAENPKLSPKNGFEFQPNKIKLTINEQENATLFVKKNLLNKYKKISIISSNNKIDYEHEINIKNRAKYIKYSDIAYFDIKLKGKKIGDTATINAKLGSKETKLSAKVTDVLERLTNGAFNDIDIRDIDSKKIADVIDQTLVLNRTHPIIKSFAIKKKYEQNKDYITLISNLLTQQVCKEITNKKVRERKLEGVVEWDDIESVNIAKELFFIDMYHSRGVIFNKIFIIFFKNEWLTLTKRR